MNVGSPRAGAGPELRELFSPQTEEKWTPISNDLLHTYHGHAAATANAISTTATSSFLKLKRAILRRSSSPKVISSYHAGDLFIGKVKSRDDDDNPLGFPYARWWGGGAGRGVWRIVDENDEPVEVTALIAENRRHRGRQPRHKGPTNRLASFAPVRARPTNASSKNAGKQSIATIANTVSMTPASSMMKMPRRGARLRLEKTRRFWRKCFGRGGWYEEGGGNAGSFSQMSAVAIEDDSDDSDVENDITSSVCDCRIVLMCCTIRNVMAALIWTSVLGTGAILFMVSAYYGIAEPGYQWFDVAFWRWTTFIGIILVSPVVCSAVVTLFLASMRRIMESQREDFPHRARKKKHVHIGKDAIRTTESGESRELDPGTTKDPNGVNTESPEHNENDDEEEEEEDDDDNAFHSNRKSVNRALLALFFMERMKFDVVRSLFCGSYLLSFALLFVTAPTSTDPGWQAGYTYTLRTFGSIFVWSLGTVLSRYITLSITKSINQQTLGERVRGVLSYELAMWRIMGASPMSGDILLHHLARDLFLVDDPRASQSLARAILRGDEMRGHMRATDLDSNVRSSYPVAIRTERQATLMGSLLFAIILRHAQKREERLVASTPAAKCEAFAVKANARMPWLNLHLAERYSAPTVARYASRIDRVWNKGVVYGGGSFARRVMTKADLANLLARRVFEEPSLPQVDAEVAWGMFDPDRSGFVTLKRAKNAVSSLATTRMNLKTTFRNAYEVVASLQSVINTVVNFFVLLIVLAIFGLDVLQVWVGISSIVLSFSFVFGNALAGIFNSSIFLFGVHPYDVGDKLLIGAEEETYFVEKISLLCTHMRRWDGAAVRFYNVDLLTWRIINVRNSGNFEWMLNFWVDAATLPSRKELEQIQIELESFLGLNRGSYSGSCSITAREVKEGFLVRLAVWIAFAYKQQDAGRVNRDKSRAIEFMVNALKKRRVRFSGGGLGVVDMDKGQRATSVYTGGSSVVAPSSVIPYGPGSTLGGGSSVAGGGGGGGTGVNPLRII